MLLLVLLLTNPLILVFNEDKVHFSEFDEDEFISDRLETDFWSTLFELLFSSWRLDFPTVICPLEVAFKSILLVERLASDLIFPDILPSAVLIDTIDPDLGTMLVVLLADVDCWGLGRTTRLGTARRTAGFRISISLIIQFASWYTFNNWCADNWLLSLRWERINFRL